MRGVQFEGNNKGNEVQMSFVKGENLGELQQRYYPDLSECDAVHNRRRIFPGNLYIYQGTVKIRTTRADSRCCKERVRNDTRRCVAKGRTRGACDGSARKAAERSIPWGNEGTCDAE